MSRRVLCLGGKLHGLPFEVDDRMRHIRLVDGPGVLTIKRIHIGGVIREVAVREDDDVDALVHAYLLELFDRAVGHPKNTTTTTEG